MTTQPNGMFDVLTRGAVGAARTAGYNDAVSDMLAALGVAGIKLETLAEAGSTEVSTLTVDANGLDESAGKKEVEAERLFELADGERQSASDKRAQASFVKKVFGRLGLTIIVTTAGNGKVTDDAVVEDFS